MHDIIESALCLSTCVQWSLFRAVSCRNLSVLTFTEVLDDFADLSFEDRAVVLYRPLPI